MNKLTEKEQSFLGLLYANKCWDDLKLILEVWRHYLNEPNRSAKFMDWDNIEFVFSDVFNKQKVYRDLAHMIAFGWFKEKKIARICKYLAKHTNLNDNEDLNIRAKNIRHGIYGQIKRFKKERELTKKDESIIITTQQGFTTAKRIA
jgi:hypothetical protein